MVTLEKAHNSDEFFPFHGVCGMLEVSHQSVCPLYAKIVKSFEINISSGNRGRNSTIQNY